MQFICLRNRLSVSFSFSYSSLRFSPLAAAAPLNSTRYGIRNGQNNGKEEVGQRKTLENSLLKNIMIEYNNPWAYSLRLRPISSPKAAFQPFSCVRLI
jgi:hypothetical protein